MGAHAPLHAHANAASAVRRRRPRRAALARHSHNGAGDPHWRCSWLVTGKGVDLRERMKLQACIYGSSVNSLS